MEFNSVEFLLFLPIVFAIYWAIPHQFRWLILLSSSYYFYMSWNPKYVVLILFITIISYAAGRLLGINKNEKIRKSILICTIVVCLGVLFFFKYFNFISESIVNAASCLAITLHPVTLRLLLPVGISFYVFQTLSYVIDVYRGDVQPEYNFGIYATFISFFPQLVAGPIERTTNLLPQINSEKKFDYDLAMYGARQMLWGFFKKVAVADVVAVYVDNVYDNLQHCTGLELCTAIFFFTIQIYCDFSGYSDIAIGTAKLLGIKLMTNFSSPYFALSVKEFWSRWHISLSTWFRDYVYIPLGGNHCSKIKSYFNVMITFLASGLWHGANWTFFVWGGVHGAAQILEKAFGLDKPKQGKCRKMISWVIVFAFCNVAWVFFRADSLHDALFVIYHTFANVTDINSYLHAGIGLDTSEFLYIGLVILAVAVYDYISLKKDVIEELKNKNVVVRLLIEYGIVICIGHACFKSAGSNPFVYFQF